MDLFADQISRDWIVFTVTLGILLFIDLFSHRKDDHENKTNAIIWSVVWIGFGLLFAVYIWWSDQSAQRAHEYLAAYLIEKVLSVDNLFVFMLIFGSLRIPKENQRRVLSWGIFGALVFRGLFIWLGVEALQKWHWVQYILAAILAVGAIRAFFEDPNAEEEESKLVGWLAKRIPVTGSLHGHDFMTRENGRLVATPLLVALISIELTDILFAVDSVPAALSVSHDIYLVYASNAFAILGLRSLYIAMSHVLDDLEYLHYGLAAVLLFAAFKIGFDGIVPISPALSIAVIVIMIGLSVAASIWRRRQRAQDDEEQAGE